MIGDKIIPITAINTSPLKSAYSEAKTFAVVFVKESTGPIPPKIMEAFNSESIQPRPASQWYPPTPISKEIDISKTAAAVYPASLFMNIEIGATF
jgi:hypothetical protein